MGTNMFSRDPQINYPAKAENDLSAKQFHTLELSGDSQVDIPDDEADICAGVLQNKPKSGRWADVCAIGITKVRAGVAITAGNKIVSASGGWVRPVSTTGSGKRIIGQVLVGASSGGTGVAIINLANAVSSVTSTP